MPNSSSLVFFFKQKTAYEMRISDGSSDVCSSDLSLWEKARDLAASAVPLSLDPQSVVFELAGLLAALDNSSEPEAVRYRSEEHTSELQSLMRISYAVFCLKKKKKKYNNEQNQHTNT